MLECTGVEAREGGFSSVLFFFFASSSQQVVIVDFFGDNDNVVSTEGVGVRARPANNPVAAVAAVVVMADFSSESTASVVLAAGGDARLLLVIAESDPATWLFLSDSGGASIATSIFVLVSAVCDGGKDEKLGERDNE